MRILLLAPHPFYIDRGTPIDVDILLRALSDAGHEVDAIVYAPGEDRQYPGVTLHRVGGRRWLRNLRPGFSPWKLLADLLMCVRAYRMTRASSYDVVHAGEEAVYIAMLLRATRGVPYVYDMDSSVAQQMVERFRWLRPLASAFSRIEGAAIRRSIAVAPVCHALADLAREQDAPHVTTLHDISQITPLEPASHGPVRKRLDVDGPVLMYVGNLEPYQGIDLLLDSFAHARRTDDRLTLVIAGGAESHIEAYRRKAEALGVGGAAHFIGSWPADRLGELLAEADVLVAPRIRGVNTPQKIFPYLHSGRAVLATDLHTHSQILDGSVARLAPPDPVAFGDAMVELARDDARREELGARGQSFVEKNHTYPAHQTRVRALYAHVEQTVSR